MKIDSPKTLGRAVRTIRKQMGLTQSELAMTAGTSLRFIVEVEKGKPTSQTGKVMTVLDTLGATIDLRAPTGITLETAENVADGSSDGT